MPGDAPAVHGFICDLEDTRMDETLFRRYFTENCTSDSNIYLAALYGPEVVGFLSCHGQILLHHLGRAYEIQEMYVHREHRSRGIGRLLVERLEQELAQQDYAVLEVTSNIRRSDTHRFYERCGFRRTHYKFTKAGPGHDAGTDQ